MKTLSLESSIKLLKILKKWDRITWLGYLLHLSATLSRNLPILALAFLVWQVTKTQTFSLKREFFDTLRQTYSKDLCEGCSEAIFKRRKVREQHSLIHSNHWKKWIKGLKRNQRWSIRGISKTTKHGSRGTLGQSFGSTMPSSD